MKQGNSTEPLTLNTYGDQPAPLVEQTSHVFQSYSAPGVSLNLQGNDAKLVTGKSVPMCLEECREQAAEVKANTPGHSEQESQSTKSQDLNPSSKMFIPLVRNVIRRPPKAGETNASLQYKRSVVDLENNPVDSKQTELSNLGGDSATTRSGNTFLMRLEECTGHTAEEEIRTSGHSEQVSQSKRSQTFNIFAKPFVPLAKKVSMCSSKADHIHASRQHQTALDPENTPVSSNKKGSFSLLENEAKPRSKNTFLIRLEECTRHTTKENITAGLTELESPPMRPLISFHKPHTSLARNVSLITPSTATLRGLLRKRDSNSKLASMESVKRQLHTECIGCGAEEKIQTSGHSEQEPHLRTPGRLNPVAKPFIPLMRNVSPRSTNADKIKASLQQKHPVLDLENMPVTSKSRRSSNLLGGIDTPRSGNNFLVRLEETIRQATEERFQTPACKEQESRPANSQFLTPLHHQFTSLLRIVSPRSHNDHEINADIQQKQTAFYPEKTPLTTTMRGFVSKRHSNSKLASIESKRRRLDESMIHAKKSRLTMSRPLTPLATSLTSMLRNDSRSPSNADKTASMQQKQAVLHPETTPTASTLESFLDSPKDNFRRTPRREYQGCLRRGEDDEDLEINGPNPHRQYECLQILSSLPLTEDNEYLDSADHQFNPWVSISLIV